MKRRNRCSGATLVEVMVSITILVILVGVSGTMLVSGMNVFYKTAELRAAQEEGTAVYELLSGRLYTATECMITNEPMEIDERTTQLIVTPQSLTLHRFWEGTEQTTVLLDADSFGAHTVRVRAQQCGEAAIMLAVDVYNADSELLYIQQGTVSMFNGGEIEILLDEEKESFTLNCIHQDSK